MTKMNSDLELDSDFLKCYCNFCVLGPKNQVYCASPFSIPVFIPFSCIPIFLSSFPVFVLHLACASVKILIIH